MEDALMRNLTITLLRCLAVFAKTVEEWKRHLLIPSGCQRRRTGKSPSARCSSSWFCFISRPTRVSSISGSMSSHKSYGTAVEHSPAMVGW